MGGILGWGYAGMHDDLEGLVTIGSPSEMGSDFFLIKLVAHCESLILGPVDLAVGLLNLRNQAAAGAVRTLRGALAALPGTKGLAKKLPPGRTPAPLEFRYIPMDALLRLFEKALSTDKGYRAYERFSQYLVLLSNPTRVTAEDIRWLLREGGEREPRQVISQFARWVRTNEMRCYRTGYDFWEGFERIHIPMAVIFGDMDKLCSVKSTARVYRSAKSEYLLWRPVKGNSHLELTMGHDIRQICYDIKNLISYAQQHRSRGPSLPRRE
jgi:pimeloyl-ACP methyl ester carboxylesterase